MKKHITALSLGFTAALLLGCAGGKKPGEKDWPGPPGSEHKVAAPNPTPNVKNSDGGDTGGGPSGPYPADKGVAVISGMVKFDGKPPRVRNLDTSADEKCHGMHKDKPLKAETAVIGSNGELANVIVYVSKGLGSYSFETTKEPVLLDQVGCRYIPHVVAVMVNQRLEIKNSDPTLHNVHGTPEINEEFNISQPTQGQVSPKEFESAEFMKVKCDVHPWMGCRIGVFEHPFFAVSGPDGKFVFKQKLVPGKYTLTAWHEKFKEQQTEIEVKEDGSFGTVAFTFTKK